MWIKCFDLCLRWCCNLWYICIVPITRIKLTDKKDSSKNDMFIAYRRWRESGLCVERWYKCCWACLVSAAHILNTAVAFVEVLHSFMEIPDSIRQETLSILKQNKKLPQKPLISDRQFFENKFYSSSPKKRVSLLVFTCIYLSFYCLSFFFYLYTLYNFGKKWFSCSLSHSQETNWSKSQQRRQRHPDFQSLVC